MSQCKFQKAGSLLGLLLWLSLADFSFIRNVGEVPAYAADA